MNRNPHNFAYFRALLEILNLEQAEAAQYLEVGLRTVERWSTRNPRPDTTPCPDSVIVELRELDTRAAEWAGDVCDSIADLVEEHGKDPDKVIIHVFSLKENYEKSDVADALNMSFTMYWGLMRRLYIVLRHEGFRVAWAQCDELEERHVTLLFADEGETVEVGL